MNKSENRIMWTTIVDIITNKERALTSKDVYRRIESYNKYNGEEVEYNFSHDNWGLILCWLHFFKKDKSVFPSLGRHTIHPIRFINFLWMKYDWLYILRCITILDMIVRHGLIRRKTGSGQHHTSGLLLDYYHAMSYKQNIRMYILTKLMKTMFSGWEEVFRVYHGNPDHINYEVYQTFLETQK